jgi:hypothetical protein
MGLTTWSGAELMLEMSLLWDEGFDEELELELLGCVSGRTGRRRDGVASWLRERYCCGMAGTVAAGVGGARRWSVGSAGLEAADSDRHQVGRVLGKGHAVVELDSSEEVVDRAASARSTESRGSWVAWLWTPGFLRYSDEVDREEWPFELS